jgi:Polyketide cyclase / dehydrase and lipid transport
MATIRASLDTSASVEQAWDAIRDVGALHTRLVPGFVADTRLEPGARIVTFVDGRVVREPIVTIDEESRRLVWSAEATGLIHYNAAVEVKTNERGGAIVVWTVDFLPDEIKPWLAALIDEGMHAMKRSLDALAK